MCAFQFEMNKKQLKIITRGVTVTDAVRSPHFQYALPSIKCPASYGKAGFGGKTP